MVGTRLGGSAPRPRGFRRSLVVLSPPVAIGPDVCTERRGGVSSADELSNRDRGRTLPERPRREPSAWLQVKERLASTQVFVYTELCSSGTRGRPP
jgi:hypothetical protein